MPYVLAPLVKKNMPGLWAEGAPYSTETIYDICSTDPEKPPVHYESHLLKPHSLCHFDAPAHILPDGDTINSLFEKCSELFYGPVAVVRLSQPKFDPHPRAPKVLHWEISQNDLEVGIRKITAPETLEKVFVTFEKADSSFYSSPTHALTLSLEAAQWLTSLPRFNLFGTLWKSVDFQPGSRERPIHKALFKRAGILECLNLSSVPEGIYFLSAFPLPLEGATESPVCPVLYSPAEVRWK